MNSDKSMLVKDSSCNEICQHRQHTITLNGEQTMVDFYFGKDTILPYEAAMKFAALDGFEVIDPEGRTVSIPQAVENVIINSDQTIAFYNELTLEALQIRAATKVGGEDFVNSEDRELLIYFIKGIVAVEEIDEGDVTDDFDPNGIDAGMIPSAGLSDGLIGFETPVESVSASDVPPPVESPAPVEPENGAPDAGADKVEEPAAEPEVKDTEEQKE